MFTKNASQLIVTTHLICPGILTKYYYNHKHTQKKMDTKKDGHQQR